MKRDIRVITPEKCEEFPRDQTEARSLDFKRAKFIVRKNFRSIAGSRRLGEIWLILDPLIVSMVYFFVFTVIRHNTNPASLFLGITYVRILQMGLRNGFNNSVDYSGGIKIERVRTRVILTSEYLLSVTNTFFMCFGVSIVFAIFFDSDILETVALFLIALPLYVMWYGIGSFFSPIGVRIPDTRALVSYFGMLMFFGSPALYSLGQTSGLHRAVCLYNPFSFFVEFARFYILGSEDYKLLDANIGISYLIIFTLILGISIKRYDWNRWRFSTWS